MLGFIHFSGLGAKAVLAPPERCVRKIELLSAAGGSGILTGTSLTLGVKQGSPIMVRACKSSQKRC